METTRNTLRAAMAALSAMAVALVAVILVSVHPVFASAAEEPVQGVAEGNISLSVPATTLPCTLTADGTVITPDADKYAFVNTGSVAVSIASPEVKLSNDVHDVNMSAKAAVVATTDKDQFKKLFNESDKQIDWILNNQGQGEQTLMQGQSLCVKFGIDPLTYDKNANVIEQAATSSGCNIASVNYAYREKRMPAYAVFFDNGRTAKLYKGYDRPVKGEPYRGSTEPVFDFVDDIENDKAEVFGQYKDVLEQVSVETEDGEIQPTTTKGWFRGCSKLASVEGLSKLDTSKVTDMSGMFCSCSGLTSLDVSKFKTGNVTMMNQMFESCRSLTSLDVSKFKTGNVTDMGYMFEACYKLTSLDVSKFDTSNVTKMTHMFWNSVKLTTLDVSGFDTSKVTKRTIAGMFYGCSGLEQVILGKGWRFSFDDCGLPETMYVKDGNGSFAEYPNVFPTTKTDTYYTEKPTPKAFAVVYDDGNNRKTAKLYKRYIEKMPIEGELFDDGCGDGSKKVFAVYDDIESEKSQSLFCDKPDVTNYLVTVTVVDSIQPSTTCKWFKGCTNLLKIVDLNKLDTSKVTDMSCMFDGCRGLTSLDVSKFDTSNVTEMSVMFYGCRGLTSLDLSGFKTGNVTGMNEMFNGCSGLTSLDLSSFNTANIKYMAYMFNGCSKLTSLNLSGWNTGNVMNMNSLFYGCSKLASLDLSGWNTGNVEFMAFMFYGCGGLTSLDLSSFNTAKVRTMSNMFDGCSGLTLLVSKFDTSNVDNMHQMFYRCSGLTSLDLSSFNTSKVKNTSFMFSGCRNLTTVTLPSDPDSKAKLQEVLRKDGIYPQSSQRTISEDASVLSAPDGMELRQFKEDVENRSFESVGSESLSGSTASAAVNAPSSNVSSAGKAEADFPGQSGGSEPKEPSAEKADNCQPDSDGSLSSDKSGSSAQEK